MRLILFLALLFVCRLHVAQAQNPGFNYQAVVRDQSGKVLINSTVNLEFDIFNQNGTLSCQHIDNNLQTNEFGIVNTVINPSCLKNLDWAAGGNYMRVRLNGSQLPGNQLLNYVPYAFIADSALHVRSYAGSGGILVSNDAVISLAPEVDADKSDDLTKTTIFNGDVNGAFDNIQIKNGVITTENIADGTIKTEDMSSMGALSGQVLTWNGAAWVAVNPGPGADDWGNQTAITAAPLTGNGASAPLSVAQQSISTQYLTDNAVTSAKIVNGTIVGADLNSMGALSGQVLKWNGASWVPSIDAGLTNVTTMNPVTGDGAGAPLGIAANGITGAYLADNAVTGAKIANGSVGNIDLDDMGATSGQILKWNGAAWIPSADAGLTSVAVSNPLNGNGAGTPLSIAPNSISNGFLADNAVSSAKILNGTIASADLSNLGASNPGQILTWNGTAWTAADPGTNTVTTSLPISGDGVNNPISLATAAVTSAYMAPNAVNSGIIQDGSIQGVDLSDSISTALWKSGINNDVFRLTGNVGVGMSNPVTKIDVRSTEGGLNLENTNPALSDFTAIRGTSKTVDFYGIGGDFEGGFIGMRSTVKPTGVNTYYGAFSSANGGGLNSTKYGVYAEATGTGTNFAIYGKANNGFPNYAGYFEGNVNVTGNFSVTGVKSFRIKHPAEPGKEIWYACIEGPEAAAYVRGTAQVVNGEVFVPFPDHFKLIIDPASLTVITTPASTDTYGLAVVEKSANGFRIKELKGGTGTFSFDWEAKAIRKGCEDFEVIRNADPTPSRGKNQ